MLSSNAVRAIAVIVLPVLFGFGPCGPIPGSELEGKLIEDKVNDFRFVKDHKHCALEVMAESAYSVTVNCWSVGKQLFIGCKDCEGKKWSSAILQNPVGKVRIGEDLYPVTATKMEDSGAIKRAWTFRWQKYEQGEPDPLPEDYWLFHMRSTPKG